ncbi:thiol:disulfide interchange protein DsbA/DsbL [Massilia sp. R2A-15]|uniref:thiol:disulfide interchange protein DsbA/DsbL n=1 Tax=Massilia sp. R2A-15 TaxID=3064278 RepID=UPI002736EFEC|nr:thiol:disulfide interchange protein DsbA/DsbL [Massilia sp. R2A-15]WLI89698.1 thiol:disulfide interchange protein DsbA/DsbL [Massilia sp. R2A-15]
MRLIRTLLCAAALVLAGFAAAAEPKNGADYLTLPEAQNTDAGNKVEVTEFFAYYCPHCNRFEPLISAWVKKQGANIVFKRVHVGGSGGIAAQQHLFYTLEALGMLDPYHQKAFDAMHIERLRLATDDAVFDWAAKAGIDRARFVEAWKSFGVQAKLRRANALMGAYRVNEWPLVAVDGRFITSPSIAGEADKSAQTEDAQQQAALKVMDYLVAKAKAEKK